MPTARKRGYPAWKQSNISTGLLDRLQFFAQSRNERRTRDPGTGSSLKRLRFQLVSEGLDIVSIIDRPVPRAAKKSALFETV